jgi:hypothetical protein
VFSTFSRVGDLPWSEISSARRRRSVCWVRETDGRGMVSAGGGYGGKRWSADLQERWVAGPRESIAGRVSVGKDGDGSGRGRRSSGDDGLRGPDNEEGGRQSVGGGGNGGEGRIWKIGKIFC